MFASRSGTSFEIRKMQLEVGDKATEWFPQYEDLYNLLGNIDSELDNINAKVNRFDTQTSGYPSDANNLLENGRYGVEKTQKIHPCRKSEIILLMRNI